MLFNQILERSEYKDLCEQVDSLVYEAEAGKPIDHADVDSFLIIVMRQWVKSWQYWHAHVSFPKSWAVSWYRYIGCTIRCARWQRSHS